MDRSDQKYVQKKFANKNYLKFHKKIRVEYTYNQLTLRLSHRSSDFLQVDFQGQYLGMIHDSFFIIIGHLTFTNDWIFNQNVLTLQL